MLWIEVACITVLGAIALLQDMGLKLIRRRLVDSTALLSATVSVIEMDDESKRTFMEQIEENKRWI